MPEIISTHDGPNFFRCFVMQASFVFLQQTSLYSQNTAPRSKLFLLPAHCFPHILVSHHTVPCFTSNFHISLSHKVSACLLPFCLQPAHYLLRVLLTHMFIECHLLTKIVCIHNLLLLRAHKVLWAKCFELRTVHPHLLKTNDSAGKRRNKHI